MANTVCHIEYQTADLANSQRFCEALFGWEFRSFGESMIVFSAGGTHIGGFSKGERPSAHANPEVDYQVDSLDEHVARAVTLGATVVTPRREVPGVGWYACVAAPDGNEFGLVEFAG